jgi:hypothetical protein
LVVATTPRIVTAQELDQMTPDERAAAFDERIVRNLDDLPSEFRARVEARGRQLAEELRSASTEWRRAEPSGSPSGSSKTSTSCCPSERSATGTPSTADFLQYEIPRILERLATDLDGSTITIAGTEDVRVLITRGMLVAEIAAYIVVRADGSVDLIALEIARWGRRS